MKSAYELAMERLGGTREYSDEQKALLAEIDSKYSAREAEARMRFEQHIGDERDPEKRAQMQERLALDLEKIGARREAEKEGIRHG